MGFTLTTSKINQLLNSFMSVTFLLSEWQKNLKVCICASQLSSVCTLNSSVKNFRQVITFPRHQQHKITQNEQKIDHSIMENCLLYQRIQNLLFSACHLPIPIYKKFSIQSASKQSIFRSSQKYVNLISSQYTMQGLHRNLLSFNANGSIIWEPLHSTVAYQFLFTKI